VVHAAYDVTITAWDNVHGGQNVPISKDGAPTGLNTPHTFTGLTEPYTFTVPDMDSYNNPLGKWNTGETSNTILVNSGGTYTAEYYEPYDVTIQAWDNENGLLHVPITKDGWPSGSNTPYTFTNLIMSHVFTVPDTDTFGTQFTNWTTGETSTSITVSTGGTYIAQYYIIRYNATIWAWDSAHGGLNVPITKDGVLTSLYTPYTFTFLIGTHVFTVPDTDTFGTQFTNWTTGETSTSITVSSGGKYTALYYVPKVATPTFSPSAGTYSSSQSVTLSCSTSGATIRFTLDDSEPSASSTAYSSPIEVSSTTTIKAKAFKTDMTDSDTASATYTMNIPWKLTINVVGSGTTDPIPGVHTFTDGTEAPVSATPSLGWKLDHWILDALIIEPMNPIPVTMVGDRNLTAIFVGTPPFVESCNQTGIQKDYFNTTDEVYVKGTGYLPMTSYDIYIVDDVAWTDGMAIPERVLGTVTSIVTNSFGNISKTLVWSSPLAEGKYDICVDVNGNGMYDQHVDALDDYEGQVTAGFVVPEFPSFLIISLFVIATLLSAIVHRKKHIGIR
jgi:hypothetical protein